MDRKMAMQGAAMAAAFATTVCLNYYAFDRLTGLLGLGCRWLSLAYAVTLAAMLGASFLVRASSDRSIKLAFVSITTIYGLEFAAISLLIPFEFLDLLVGLPNHESGVAIACFVAAVAIVSAANAQLLNVRTIRLDFPTRLRVVQISDTHIGAVHGRRYLARVVDAVNALGPDLVLITGDTMSGAVDVGKSGLEGFAGIKAPTYLAPGNHEFYEGMDEVRAALPANVTILRDEEVDMGEYSVFGLDFLGDQGVRGTRTLDMKFSKPVIAMAHTPQFLDLPNGSIILAGHYHAGQVFPFNFLGHLFIGQFWGLYRKGGVTLYVSPGTATWGPPMRFGSMNEITLLELGPE